MIIEHIAMYVEELEKARDFFTLYFDGKANALYRNEKTGFSSYIISFDGGARLEIMNKPNLARTDTATAKMGYAHIAFSVGGREKVDALTERLRNDGYRIVSNPRITGDGYYESCIIGIEGNLIEITA